MNASFTRRLFSTFLVLFLVASGCVRVPNSKQQLAKERSGEVASKYRPYDKMPELPQLTTNSLLSDFILFAVYKSPSVESAFYEWISSVEKITVERSYPDPVLTFQLDLTKMLEALMPGLMVDIPGKGKVETRTLIAVEESEINYQKFIAEILKTIHTVKTSYYRIYLLKQKISLIEEKIEILTALENTVRFNIHSGNSDLIELISIQSEEQRSLTEIKNLQNFLDSAVAEFKYALGLKSEDLFFAVPVNFQFTTNSIEHDMLLKIAFSTNPGLKALESEIRQADAEIALAISSKHPDFKAGLETSIYPAPIMYRPQLGMSLPIWKDKIRAQISAAQTKQKSTSSRLNSKEIEIAANFAAKLYELKESETLLNLYVDYLLPQIRTQTEIARNRYVVDGKNLIEIYNFLKSENEFKLQALELRVKRELILSEITLLIGGILPEKIRLLLEYSNSVQSSNSLKPEN